MITMTAFHYARVKFAINKYCNEPVQDYTSFSNHFKRLVNALAPELWIATLTLA